MKIEDALALVPQIKAFKVAHSGTYPSLHSEDANEKHLAQVQAFLTAQRAKWERDKARREAESSSESAWIISKNLQHYLKAKTLIYSSQNQKHAPTADDHLIESFSKITLFVRKYGRMPDGDSEDLNEAVLGTQLNTIRATRKNPKH